MATIDPYLPNEKTPWWATGCGVASIVLWLGLFVSGATLAWFVYRASDDGNVAVDTAQVHASSGRVTREQDDGDNRQTFDRLAGTEVWFRVTLDSAPVGKRLNLHCEWIDPTGRIVHRNQYTTKIIHRTPWPTHARYRLNADSPLGTWRVRLLLGPRELRSQGFEVREGRG